MQMPKQTSESNALLSAITQMTDSKAVDLRVRATTGEAPLINSYNAFLDKLSELMASISTGSNTLTEQSTKLSGAADKRRSRNHRRV